MNLCQAVPSLYPNMCPKMSGVQHILRDEKTYSTTFIVYNSYKYDHKHKSLHVYQTVRSCGYSVKDFNILRHRLVMNELPKKNEDDFHLVFENLLLTVTQDFLM